MKRSEMLEETRKILALNSKDDGYGELEEAILHHIEVCGMLPPPTSLDCVTESLLYCYYPKIKEKEGNWEVLDRDTSHLWEAEDEER